MNISTIRYFLKYMSQGPRFIYRDDVPVQKHLDAMQQLERYEFWHDTDGGDLFRQATDWLTDHEVQTGHQVPGQSAHVHKACSLHATKKRGRSLLQKGTGGDQKLGY